MAKKKSANESLMDFVTSSEVEEASAPKAPATSTDRPRSYLSERLGAINRVSAGEIIDNTLFLVEPERCRMWERHNRRYDLLNQERCQDLIDQLIQQGKQEIPAIVRKLENDPDHEYEVIAGARRHWSITWLRKHNYTNFKFLIDVRNLTDEEAFRLADVENRGHQDISDYERAADYLRALEVYGYYETQQEMAKRLEMAPDELSRFLNLARLPEPVVAAFDSITSLKAQHARDLQPLLRGGKAKREQLLARAEEIKQEQDRRRAAGTGLMDAAAVVKQLKAADAPLRKRPTKPLEIRNSEGAVVLRVKPSQRSVDVKILRREGLDVDTIVAALRPVLGLDG